MKKKAIRNITWCMLFLVLLCGTMAKKVQAATTTVTVEAPEYAECGTQVTLTARLEGDSLSNTSYQWYYRPTMSLSDASISGATESTYTISNFGSSSSEKSYRCVVNGSYKSNLVKVGIIYNITYDANGGTGAPEAQKKYSDQDCYVPETIPVKEGYDFQGWGTYSGTSTVSYEPGERILCSNNLTLYAVWKLKEYKITFNSNGGSTSTSTQTKQHGKNIYVSKTASRTGYDFVGWSEDMYATAAQYEYFDTITENRDMTLYAVWKIRTYTLSYDANGGTGVPGSVTAEYGTNVYVSGLQPEREHYLFKGWAKLEDAAGAEYASGDIITLDSTMTLYAVWDPEKYSILYVGNGGTNVPDEQVKKYGTNLTLSAKKPERSGYSFLGWSTDIQATTAEYVAGGTYEKNSNAILYAVWKKDTSGSGGTNAPTGGGSPQTPSGPVSQTITAASKTVAYKSKAFNLNAKTNGGGKLTYKSSDTKVIKVSSTGKVTVAGYGQATITITAAANGNYLKTTKKITITVGPEKVTLKSVKSPSKKMISSSWKKDSTATGYQMYISTNSKFKTDTYTRTYKKSTTSAKLTGLKSKKTYYVKIRAYKTVKGKKCYGVWSTVKKVKIK